MSLNKLYAVTKDVVGQSTQAGHHALRTWRALGHRVAQASQQRVASRLQGRALPLMSRELTEDLVATHAQFTELCAAGWAYPAARTGVWIDRMDQRLQRHLDRVTDIAALIERPLAVKALDVACAAVLPGAHLTQSLAQAAEAGGRKLQARWAPAAVSAGPRQATPKRRRMARSA